jgi:hypothetical protein
VGAKKHVLYLCGWHQLVLATPRPWPRCFSFPTEKARGRETNGGDVTRHQAGRIVWLSFVAPPHTAGVDKAKTVATSTTCAFRHNSAHRSRIRRLALDPAARTWAGRSVSFSLFYGEQSRGMCTGGVRDRALESSASGRRHHCGPAGWSVMALRRGARFPVVPPLSALAASCPFFGGGEKSGFGWWCRAADSAVASCLPLPAFSPLLGCALL